MYLVCYSALVKYRMDCRDEIRIGAGIEPAELRWDVGSKCVRDGVAACIMCELMKWRSFA